MDLFDKLKMEMGIKEMWGMLDTQIQLYEVTSRLLKEYYNALIKEGFTDKQAIELVKRFGINGAIGNDGGDKN